MSSSTVLRFPASSRSRVGILALQDRAVAREAMVEALRTVGAGEFVEVWLILDGEGELAQACLTPVDAQWLELRVGDIVPVRRVGSCAPCTAG